MRTCADCAADITNRHGNARLCERCAKTRQIEATGQGTRTQQCAAADDECSPGRLRKGMCERHYRRWAKTGSTQAETIDHLARYVEDANGCWLWTGPMFRNGYGHISSASFGTTLAHRAFYAHHVGPIPDSADLDHLCRVRHCVNPLHLEPVEHAENIQRGVDYRLDGRCSRGHDMTEDRAYWIEPSTNRRTCRKCKALREKEGRARRALARE